MEIPKEFLEPSSKDSPSFATTWTALLHKVQRYWFVLRHRWWILLLTICLGLGGAAWWSLTQEAMFASVGRMMVSGKVSIPDGTTYSEELANFYGTQIELMRSGEVRRRAQEKVQAIRPDLSPSATELEVAQLRGAAIFTLRATSPHPLYSQLFLDACMEEYINSKREIRTEKSENTVTAITGELVRLEKELREGEQELLDFQKKNNVGFLQEEGNSAATYMVTLNRQMANLRTEYDLLKLLDIDQNLDRVRKDNAGAATSDAGAGSVLSSFGPEAEYLKAKQQVELLKAQRDDFSKVLRPAHPIMVQLEEDISRLETLINTFRSQSIGQLKTRRESIALQLENLQTASKEWEAKALDLGQRMAEYERMKSKVDRAKAVYDRLLTSLRNVDVTQRIDQDMVSILEKASAPMSVRPGLIKMALIGLGAGLAVGLAILALLELIDDRITSFPQLQAQIDDRILAQIPHEEQTSGDVSPLRLKDERHALAESFRSLRSSLYYLPQDGHVSRSVLVTSAVPNEGKSFVATNLAHTLAFGGSKVLLIDADLRRGDLHGVLGVTNKRGFGDVLSGNGQASEAIQHTSIENLDLLSRGTITDPGELFLSKECNRLLAELSSQYDHIILDTAPMLVADDTASLSPKTDACIYVVRFAFSALRTSRKGLEMLKARRANVLGIVCNEVHSGMPEYYYHYRYTEYYGHASQARG